MDARLRSIFTLMPLQRRSFSIVFFIIGLLALSRIAEYGVVRYYNDHWDEVVENKSAEQLRAVTTAFVGVQRSARRIAAELARHEDVTEYLLGKASSSARLFEQAARIARNQDVGAEVYDKVGTLVAWQGRSGVLSAREIHIALQGVLTSYVTRGPIFSQLFVITPVRVEGAIVGAVLIRKTIEVNYPLSNKFITRAGLAEQLSRDLGVTVEIGYGEDAEARKDGRYISTNLNGIDGRKLGVASILKLGRSTYLEYIALIFERVNAFLYLLLLVPIAVLLTRFVNQTESIIAKALIVTISVWLTRYALLWLDIPLTLMPLGIFDPVFFASKFGGGIAKSIGELTLTSIALLVNTWIVLSIVQTTRPGKSLRPSRFPFVARIVFAVLSTAFLFLLLRGYAAAIRSAVFDSNLRFNDPHVIVPSFELALMVFDLLAITVCFIVVNVTLTRFIASVVQGNRNERSGWLFTAILFVTAVVLFDVLQETPLMSIALRGVLGATMFLLALFIHARNKRGDPFLSLANVVLAILISAVFFYPLLDEVIREKDRERIEVFAREAIRPADAWLTFVVDEALHRFVTDEAFDILLHGNATEVERLAFTCWAKSNAAKQGYNCSFSLTDPAGRELSRFVIGEQVPSGFAAMGLGVPNGTKQIEARILGSGVNSVKVYAGSMPIVVNDQLLGYGVVVISAAQQPLFRGDTPQVFRTVAQENLASFYRPVAIAEFHNGRLLSSDNASLPIGYTMPASVRDRLKDSRTSAVWSREKIDEKSYETYFVRRAEGSDSVIALSLEEPKWIWHLFGIVRVLVYYALVLVAGISVWLVGRWSQANPYQFTFRDKLLVALVVTAAIPVIIISNYTRNFARERLVDNLSQRLNQETTVLAQQLLRSDSSVVNSKAYGPSARFVSSPEVDFNIYTGSMLSESSRPELYDTGILDRRLSGSAYANVFVKGKRFHLETENIGLYQYAVGYKPLVSKAGLITGAVAVPTLYRQEQIDEEVARTNAIMFGVSALIVFAIALIATTFANRIASPIHKLTEATKRVSMGDLDVKVNARAEGEIGELIQSFDKMTRDLKRSRENLVQYERELAWKEMAKQVAHEIKNPITPMKLALQHLRQTYYDRVENFGEVFEEVSQMVIRQVDALSRIASEFSSFARMPKARFEKCSVNDVLRETVSLFERDGKVQFDVALDKHLPPIQADREELRRAFINIVRNGMQAMENEGRMIITSSLQGSDIEVRIQDFGSGIPDEIRGKLFQPNFSTKTDGMGLGLAIVKKTIEDLNGSIAIESELQQGTTIIINLPHTIEHHEFSPHHSG